MADLNDLLSQAANAIAPTPATANPAPTAAQTIDATSARIQQSLSFLTPQKQSSVLETMGNLTPQSYPVLAGAAVKGSTAGLASASPIEHDLRTMSPAAFSLKYGNDGQQISDNYVSAQRDASAADAASRSGLDIAGDSARTVADGLVSTIGGLGAWGAGLVNPKLGANLAQGLSDFNTSQQAMKSQVAQDQANITQGISSLDQRDNQAQYIKDVAAGPGRVESALNALDAAAGYKPTDHATVSAFAREGKNLLDEVGNDVSNPTVLGEGAANAVGSLLATGPVAKVIGLGGKAISSLVPQATKNAIQLSAALDAGTGVSSVSRLLAGAAEKTAEYVPGTLAIGGMEGAGAYQQTASDVMQKDFDTLGKESPQFNQLVAGGMSQEDARATLAGQAGQSAAWKQGIAGAALGVAVAPFEAHPFKLGGVRTAAQNIGKETVEEGLQNASGQVIQNQAEQQTGVADPDQDLLTGVGAQLGQGALYGGLAAAHTAAPGVVLGAAIRAPLGALNLAGKGIKAGVDAATPAVKAGLSAAGDITTGLGETATGVAQAAGSALKGGLSGVAPYVSRVTDYLAKRGDAVMTKNDAASPVSDDVVNQAAQDVQNNAPAQAEVVKQAVNETPDLSQENKDQVNNYVDRVSQVADLKPEEVASWAPAVQQVVGDAKNRMDAINSMQRYVADTTNPESDRLAVGAQLETEKADIGRFNNETPPALDSLPADHPARTFVSDIASFAKGVDATPSSDKASRATAGLMEKSAELLKPITDESIKTPQGQADAQTLAGIAVADPTKVDPASARVVLNHYAAGNVNLTDPQVRALKSAGALMNAAIEHSNTLRSIKGDALSPQELVAENVTTGDSTSPFKQSALEHAQGIRAAYNSGDFEGARNRLLDLQKFAQSQQNKLAAINTHLVTGNGDKSRSLNYLALSADADRTFKPSKEVVGVKPTNAGSVGFARTVASEAKFLTDFSNHLATAFPELGVKHLEQTPLDPRLANGTIDDVVNGFKDGTRTATTGESTEGATQVAEPIDSTKAEAAPVVTSDASPKDTAVTPTSELQDGASKQTVTSASEPSVNQAETTPATKVDDAVKGTEKEEVPVTNGEKGKLAESYPKLVSPEQGGNKFLQSFRPSKDVAEGTGPSRAVQHEEPIAPIAMDVLKQIRGMSDVTKQGVQGAYKDLFDLANGLAQSMRDQLASKLADGGLGAKFVAEEGKAAYAHRWPDTKVLNLTEIKDGKVQYNEQLLQAAALAGVQWLLSSGQLGGAFDEKQASDLTGVPEALVTTTMMNDLKGSIGTLEALNTMAQKIQSYWGVKSNHDAPIGYTDGIPLSMAAEVMRALVSNKAIEVSKMWVDTTTGPLTAGPKDGKDTDTIKSINRITPVKIDKDQPARKNPDLIERAVMVNPVPSYYFGKDQPSTPETQMRSQYVKNTSEDLVALTNEIKTAHYLNPVMANLYSALGPDDSLRWFGAGDALGKSFNVNHAKSLEGVNMTTRAAYSEFENLRDAINTKANELGIAPEEVENHYGYNNTVVGRMHMLGKYNPQSTKFIREVMLPTRATLDLYDADHSKAFELGLAQALGIKVHNSMFEGEGGTQEQLHAMLNGPFAPAVSTFQEWLGGQKWSPIDRAEVENAFKAAGQDITPLALHALTEYARSLNLSDEDRGAFQTSKYLEADGMTNGAVNAMALHSTGDFTESWIKNMRKGGLTVGGDYSDSSMKIRTQVDSSDLYKATTDRFKQAIKDQRSDFQTANQPEQIEQQNHLIHLMDEFLPDLEIDDTGKLVVGRSVLKNPLTITIYGSGANGIAGKVMNTFVEKIYERMSDALQRQLKDKTLSDADAFYPNDKDADLKWQAFNDHMDALTQQMSLYSNKTKSFFMKDASLDQSKVMDRAQFARYTLSADELNAMQANVRSLFVTPMRSAITDTVGDLDKSTTLIRKATQVQSIFMNHLFTTGVEAALAAKAEADPSFKKDEFLSQNELGDVMASLDKFHPQITTGSQTFFVAGSQNSGVKATDFGRALNGEFRTPAYVYGPANSGVAGIPFLNIGMGDGRMMQLIAQDGSVARTLKIFDGMNMPLDQIKQQSEVANKAVYESWQGNPMQAISDAYTPFLKALSKAGIKDADIPVAMHRDLVKALFGQDFSEKDKTLAQVREAMKGLVGQIDEAALQVEARHNVLDKVNLSVDQMAAAGAPHVETGKIQLHGTDEEIAAQLTQMYHTEVGKLRATEAEKAAIDVPAEAPKETTEASAKVYTDDVSSAVNSFGSLDRNSGARVQSFTSTNKIRAALRGKIDPVQQQVLDETQRSLATKGYKIISGTPEQLSTFMATKGDVLPFDAFRPGMNGFTMPSSQRIYLVNPSAETMIHEMVHAATFEKTLAYYEFRTADDLGSQYSDGYKVSDVTLKTFDKLEGLMAQFRSLDLSKESYDTVKAYNDAIAAMDSYAQRPNQTAETRASELNEFMAWALANKSLTTLGQKTEVSPYLQTAKDAFDWIKKLIYGNKQVLTKPGNDLFSNLLFNTAVVMREQPTTYARVADSTLFHSTNYGNDPRLEAINQGFNNIISSFVKDTPIRQGQTLPKAQKLTAQLSALRLVTSAQAHGFPMSMQESSTFRLIVTALATEADIDGSSLAHAQELFAHVTKNLKVENFMKTAPEANDPADRYQAQQKFDTVMGNFLTEVDGAGRTSLLPMFIGLATVNDDFRDVLHKMTVPGNEKSNAGFFMDSAIENVGTTMMNALSNRMAGVAKGKVDSSVASNIDALTQHILDIAQKRQSFWQQNPVGEAIDQVNTATVEGISRLQGKIIDNMDDVIANSPSKVKRNLAEYAKAAVSLATEERSNILAQSVVELMNRADMWKPFSDLVYDMVGRTDENAPVYDMIKAVRANVQQDRQNYREHVPGIIGSKFSRQLSDEEWSTLHKALGRTDIASLRDGFKNDDIMKMLGDQKTLDKHINDLEQQVQAADPANWNTYQTKMQQLSKFMMDGTPGSNLLRNAHAISLLSDEKKSPNFVKADAATKLAIDHLTSLYALDRLSVADKSSLLSLVQKESGGLGFATDYLVGQRAEETRKAEQSDVAKMNGFKGFIPIQQQQGVSLLVADDSRFNELATKSYLRVGDYKGSSADGLKTRKGYYFASVDPQTLFNQGIFQNVRQSVNGVDIGTGYSNNMQTAGRITDRAEVARTALNLSRGESGTETLMPVRDGKGKAIGYERSLDPLQLQRLNPNDNLAQMIGIWRGRQVEEAKGQKFNEALVNALHDRYTSDMKESASKQAEYVNLFDPREQAKDPVLADAVRLMTPETKSYVKSVFGKEFYVSRDMLNDAMGYRSASVGDAFTGNTRWSPETQEYMKRVMIGTFGNKAYEYFTTAEKTLQNFIGDAKTLIVVKSVVVPVTNMIGNMLQLIGRGVPMKQMVGGLPKKLSETNLYVKGRDAQIKLEADLRSVTDDPVATRKLTLQWQALEDGFKRLSIYPLIQAGEFTAISDAASLGPEDVALTSGKLHSAMESYVQKLPDSVRNFGRYALVTKDTALFKGLQKSVEYGDFLAKALLYDDIVKRQGKSPEYALSRITEEFVNYDRLPGRFRGYLESMGLLWFYNFKIRAAKVAMSMVRNNPVHSILAAAAPIPSFLGDVGTPLGDNFFSKLFTGGLSHSFGMGQVFHAPMMNPWVHLTQ